MLQKLWFNNFRNIKELQLKLNPSAVTFIYGDNNQGKTNLLEGVYVLGNAHSPKAANLQNCINFFSQEFILGAEFIKNNEPQKLYQKFNQDFQKYIICNNKPMRRVIDLQKRFNIDYLSADCIKIFQENPENRRVNLDRFLCIFNPNYQKLLKNYERVIKHKNKLLKTSFDKSSVMAFNEQLLTLAVEIVKERLMALDNLKNILKSLILNLKEPGLDNLEMVYIFKSLKIEKFVATEYSKVLKEKLTASFEKEVTLGFSLYGPHRDDFYLELNHKNLFLFSSRGINRIFAILFKLAQLIAIEQKYQTFPLLLIDDAFVEIDTKKKQALGQILAAKTQILYATVSQEDQNIFSDPELFQIQDGKICNA